MSVFFSDSTTFFHSLEKFNMDINKANQILRIAKMYYEEHLSQQQISEAEEISKSTVSRLLKKAEELGYIEVKVVQPFFSTADLESEIRNKYNLKKVTVIPNLIENEQALIRDINKIVLEDLAKLIKDGSSLGLAWGNTLKRLSEEAEMKKIVNKNDVKIVQLNGSASPVLKDFGCLDVVKNIAKHFNADGYQVCAPAFVDNANTAQMLKNDSQVSKVFEYGKNCDVALFSAGCLREDGVIFNLGCLSEEEINELRTRGAVGDICSHFLTEEGKIAYPELDERCMAVEFDDLINISERILVVYGSEKKNITKAILENGFVTRVYMDESLAKELLK